MLAHQNTSTLLKECCPKAQVCVSHSADAPGFRLGWGGCCQGTITKRVEKNNIYIVVKPSDISFLHILFHKYVYKDTTHFLL